MSSLTAGAATLPRPPARARAIAVMAGVGALTGLVSSLPSPLPDLRLEDPEILINADGIPLHAGIAFGAGLAVMLWLWANRDIRKCLLAMALTLMGWLAAVNTANERDELVKARDAALVFEFMIETPQSILGADGERLRGRLAAGPLRVQMTTRVRTGWMPIPRSSLTECWVGFVFSSPADGMNGRSVR